MNYSNCHYQLYLTALYYTTCVVCFIIVHRKTNEQVRRLRGQVHKKEIKIDKPTTTNTVGNKKIASTSKKKAETDIHTRLQQDNKVCFICRNELYKCILHLDFLCGYKKRIPTLKVYFLECGNYAQLTLNKHL